ncbi:hypothetical protein BJ973_004164 [Actinoplanes tereljensis]|uniref:DUF1996 domain-containing protein n=1 Tax=Paractinoplanes tereljensis TaxID=571912 RepID=A0A919TWS4_9ACTN|nr:DUF1996 domain-containing protein [Actinoplanes tereljensis]GIF23555.1 hypothetical protein Ate02nite_62850 [Actinoplanes tereljensis]
MKVTDRQRRLVRSRAARVTVAAAVLAACGALTVTFVSGGGRDSAAAATDLSQYVAIAKVAPNVTAPPVRRGASTGRFTVDCGTNGNGKFSPDNPVAQPGIVNGAEHLHDFVGNLAITANTSDADLAKAGTTCRNGDRSSYFWPVVRIDDAVRPDAAGVGQAVRSTVPTVSCPRVADRLPAIPAQVKSAVDAQLRALSQPRENAERRLAGLRGRLDTTANSSVLETLRLQRAAHLRRIGELITAAGGKRPANLVGLAECDLSYDALHALTHTRDTTPAAELTVRCPSTRDKLPGVPAAALAEVDAGLAELDRQQSEADERLVDARGQADPDFARNAVLGPLAARRAATLDRIAIAIGRNGTRPQGLDSLAACSLSRAATPAPSASPTTSALPEPQGRDLELPNNTGGIVRPATVRIEYRGNPTGKVVAMPKFLRELTGDAKPTSRGPANARATWTCSGFTDRLTDKYPICPRGSRVTRVQDFPGCWDGVNIDSANHRAHVAFADRTTGACPAGFKAIPQLRITIAYDIARDDQVNGRYALDSFPEENHNPFSDHNDFINVNSTGQMKRITACLNTGRQCS